MRHKSPSPGCDANGRAHREATRARSIVRRHCAKRERKRERGKCARAREREIGAEPSGTLRRRFLETLQCFPRRERGKRSRLRSPKFRRTLPPPPPSVLTCRLCSSSTALEPQTPQCRPPSASPAPAASAAAARAADETSLALVAAMGRPWAVASDALRAAACRRRRKIKAQTQARRHNRG